MVREVVGTDRLAEATRIREQDVDIFLGEDAGDKVAQMALVSVALSLRCVRGRIRVHFCGKEPAGLSWSDKSTRVLLEDEALTYGEPDRLQFGGTEAATFRLGLGVEMSNGVFADASGWEASVNRLLGGDPATHGPAAVFSTCCAFAKLFAVHLLGRDEFAKEAWSFSLRTMGGPKTLPPDLPSEPLHLGRIGVLGAGAIGSGFTYCIWLSRWSVDLDIIDRDTYGEPNQETTMFVGSPEVWRTRKKAIALAELARRPGLTTRPFPEEVGAESPILGERRDAFVCAVDNPDTRRVLDGVNCHLLLNGGVGGGAEDAGHVLWTRHTPGEPRLSVRYAASEQQAQSSLPPPLEMRNDKCSRIAYNDVALAAPFIGLSAGALLAASCGLQAAGWHPPVNYLKLDLLKLQSKYMAEAYRSAQPDVSLASLASRSMARPLARCATRTWPSKSWQEPPALGSDRNNRVA